MLKLLNATGDPEENHILRLFDYFYFKEHLFIVSELLGDNLYEYSKYIAQTGAEPFFTIKNLKRISRQCLEALRYIHACKLIHCDLKPENIVVKSFKRVDVKIIDFGSSCFTTDHLTTYIQSRSYRAPEVILGLPYSAKIDVWSLGCIIAELYTGRMLFENVSLPTLLGKIISILGPFPRRMLLDGTDVHKFFTAGYDLFERVEGEEVEYSVLYPEKQDFSKAIDGCEDQQFLDFLLHLLVLEPNARPTAEEALSHPWLVDE